MYHHSSAVGRHGRVEFHGRQVVRLDLADRRERVVEASDGEAALRHQRPLLIDDDGIEAFRRQERPLVAALALGNFQLDRTARVATRRHAERELTDRLKVVADVHVAVPQAWDERLAGAIDDPCASGQFRQRLADADDLAVRGKDILPGHEPLLVGVIDFDVLEQHRPPRSSRQEFLSRRRSQGRDGPVLRRLELVEIALIARRQERQSTDRAKKPAALDPQGLR